MGVTFGSTDEQEQRSPVIVNEQSIDEVEVVKTSEVEPFIEEDNPNMIQKTAGILESGVSLFYELIVGVLYEFSSLFYETEG